MPVSSRGQDTWFSATGPGFESPYRYHPSPDARFARGYGWQAHPSARRQLTLGQTLASLAATAGRLAHPSPDAGKQTPAHLFVARTDRRDILDFSKIEAGKLELEHSAVRRSRECVEDALDLLARRRPTKGLELACAGRSRRAPARLVGDPSRAAAGPGRTCSATPSSSPSGARSCVEVDARSDADRRAMAEPHELRRARHRHRHPRRPHATPVRAASRQVDASTTRQVRRHRPRAGHQPPARRADGRAACGSRARSAAASTFHFTIAGEASRGRARDPSGSRQLAGLRRADRGRQQDATG